MKTDGRIRKGLAALGLFCVIVCLPGRAAPVVIKNGSSSYDAQLQEVKNQIREKEVGRYGMTPVYPRDIEDGTYEIQAESSSPFFRITDARILVEGEKMQAEITLSSVSYQYVYLGTGQEAQLSMEDSQSGLIQGQERDGQSTFSFSLEALNQEIDCAAFSKNRQQWYDRKLVFDASTLPEGALLVELPDYELIEAAILAYQTGESQEETREGDEGEGAPEPVEPGLADGEYSIEVNMTGGSGRASVSSPTLLTVRDGKAYATLLWSSAYYDYMIVGGATYYNQTTDGGKSVFEIPVTAMDEPMSVIADTTAMGEPVEIAYTLIFYRETVGEKGQIPQEAAKKVLVIAVFLIAAGGILNHFLKKRRQS